MSEFFGIVGILRQSWDDLRMTDSKKTLCLNILGILEYSDNPTMISGLRHSRASLCPVFWDIQTIMAPLCLSILGFRHKGSLLCVNLRIIPGLSEYPGIPWINPWILIHRGGMLCVNPRIDLGYSDTGVPCYTYVSYSGLSQDYCIHGFSGYSDTGVICCVSILGLSSVTGVPEC